MVDYLLGMVISSGYEKEALVVRRAAAIAYRLVVCRGLTVEFPVLVAVWGRCEWGAPTLRNTAGALVALFVVFDFFYTLFHRALHIRAVYPWVHKHHHRQLAPSRGNADAINVHPFEFVCGEYNHLLAIALVPHVHVATAFAFIVVGGVLASLNHTRHDVRLEPKIYAVNVHDVHHRVPMSNYGQYTMFWDRLMGSYIPFTEVAKKTAKAL